ncbi:MAG: stage 0 sporulation family protein [Oscillospiraceae bacterium]|nr:stage 0 sporulation family protein [Candidatus Limimonas coprohippi]
MTEIVGIRFKEVGKIYCFDPKGQTLTPGQFVIVETARGVECGQVATGNEMVSEDKIVAPLKPIVRIATEDDLKKVAENKEKEKSAFKTCEEKIAKHGLEMKLTEVEYTFDGSKILFYFTADGRVDFRELVKDLAAVFKTRIELRQIGVRDEAKMLGGIGICGRPYCCNSYLGEFAPVSIKMAKEQGLSLNPTKISGACGRLMCCLKYEQDSYEHLAKITPKPGALVDTKDGKGIVVESNLISGMIKVRLDRAPEAVPSTYNRKQVKILRDVKTTVSKEEREALKAIEE